MDLTRRLQLLLKLDELKIDTTTTREIAEILRKLIYLNGDKKIELQKLIEHIRQSFREMLDSVEWRRSVTSKLDKLYCLFHEFSLGESFELCNVSEKKFLRFCGSYYWKKNLLGFWPPT